MALLSLHILAQQLIYTRLVARALLLEPGQYIGIKTDRHGLFGWNPQLSLAKKIIT
jgi:hypothetical protein